MKNDFKLYDNIRSFTTGQGDDYTTGCLLNYNYFKKHYKIIAINLSEQQKLNSDPKAIKQINFTKNMKNDTPIFSIIEEAKETLLDFSKGTVKVFWFDFVLIKY